MTTPFKLVLALPLLILSAGCVPSGDGGINSQQDLEASINTDLDADGTITEGAVETPA